MRSDGEHRDPSEAGRAQPVRGQAHDHPHGHSSPQTSGKPRGELDAQRPTTRPAGEHDLQHEHWILTALELEPGDPAQARHATESCTQCADDLQRFDELRQLLDEAGASQSETLAQVRRALRAGDPAPGEELVAPFVRAKLGQAAPRRPRLRLLAPLAAAAAAAAVLLGWLMRSKFPLADDHGRGVMLGEHSDKGLSPAGEVREYGPFRWPMQRPPGGSFNLRVWDAREDDPRRALYIRERIEENEVCIEAADLAKFPDAIGWDVQACDATGQDVGAPRRAYAKRSR